MDAEDQGLPPLEVAVHPLDLVGVDVGGGALDGGGEVDDGLALGGGAPHVEDGVADVAGQLELAGAEGLRAVLEAEVGARLLVGQAPDRPGGLEGEGHHLVAGLAEHQAAEHRRGGVVEVDDGSPGAPQGGEGALDERLAGGGQDLQGHPGRDPVLLDQPADEVELGLRRRGEADLDLTEADGHQQLEHPPLALAVHRLDQRLVPVAQVGAAPDRGAVEHPARPAPVGQGHRRGRPVLAARILFHRHGTTVGRGGL
jgi:hypothetical protein